MKDRGPRSLGILPIAGSLLVLVLLIVVALQVYGGKGDDDQAVTKPIEQAKILQCRTQVRNLATAVEMYGIQNNRYPDGLHDLDAATDGMLQCPVTGSAYSYDSGTGRVWCPDHP